MFSYYFKQFIFIFSPIFFVLQSYLINSVSAQQPTEIYLPIILSSGPKTSVQLIDEAYSNKLISFEQMLTYKILTAYKDNRLPANFKSDSSGDMDPLLFDKIIYYFDTFTKETQDVLLAFLVAPDDPRNWRYLTIQTNSQFIGSDFTDLNEFKESVKSQNDVRIWYIPTISGAKEKAEFLKAEIDNTIYPKLMEAMGGRRWKDDYEMCLAFPIKPILDECNHRGGDGALDVYLDPKMPKNKEGKSTILGQTRRRPNIPLPGTNPHPYDSFDGPVFTYLDVTLSEADLATVLAHEMMHAVQRAYKVKDVDWDVIWLTESTATWFMVTTYPQFDNGIKGKVDYFLQNNTRSLNDIFAIKNYETGEIKYYDDNNQNAAHAAFLFFYYLTHSKYPNSIVGEIWKYTTSNDSLTAMQAALQVNPPPGANNSLNDIWKDFLVSLWNQYYQTIVYPWIQSGGGIKPKEWDINKEFSVELPKMASDYYHIKVDPSLKIVIFNNGWNYNIGKIQSLYGIKYGSLGISYPSRASLQAFIKIADTAWKLEDWSEKSSTGFCLDVIDERIEDIVLIFGNGNNETNDKYHPYRPIGMAPFFQLIDVGCLKWKGKITSWKNIAPSGECVLTIDNATFIRKGVLPDNSTFLPLKFDFSEGNLTYVCSGTWSYPDIFQPGAIIECTISGTSGSENINLFNSDLSYIRIWHNILEGDNYKRYSGWASESDPSPSITYETKCTNENPVSHSLRIGTWLSTGETKHFTDGNSLDDTSTNFQWKLNSERGN